MKYIIQFFLFIIRLLTGKLKAKPPVNAPTPEPTPPPVETEPTPVPEEKPKPYKPSPSIITVQTALQGEIPDNVLIQMADIEKRFGEWSPLQWCHFFARGMAESGFKEVRENMNYTATRLMKIWKNYFPTIEKAKEYERNPQKLANYVYGKRMGNKAPNDGWENRGVGYTGLTGKETIEDFLEWAGLPLDYDRDKLANEQPLLTAAWFYVVKKNVFKYAKDATLISVRGVCIAVNGGLIGFDDQLRFFKRFWNKINAIEKQVV